MASQGQEISYEEVAAKLDELEAALCCSEEKVVCVLGGAVPTYRHTVNCECVS